MWNMEEKKIQGFEQAVRVLPLRLRQEAMALPEEQRARVEELRLRWGRPMAAVLPEGERPLGGEPVTGQELEPVSYTHLDVYKRQLPDRRRPGS